jgi:Na+-driven multidrug efflux pump
MNSVVWWDETQLFLHLAIPTIILQVGSMLPNVCAAAYIGGHRQSSQSLLDDDDDDDNDSSSSTAVYMSAFMLANNTANLLTLSLLWGLFTALDTLAPQAYGSGNFKQVGIVAMRGYMASLALILPIALFTAIYIVDILIALGQDVMASQHAATWYRIFLCCLPFYALYMVTWKFLSAQNVMMPLTVAAVVSNAVVVPCAMKYWTSSSHSPIGNFAGTAAAVVTYHVCQVAILHLYLYLFKPFQTECWPGLVEAWKAATVSWESFELFLYLGAGGILSSSECTCIVECHVVAKSRL